MVRGGNLPAEILACARKQSTEAPRGRLQLELRAKFWGGEENASCRGVFESDF